MAAIENTYREPTYGNWRRPRKAGIGTLGGLATAGLFVGLIITVICLFVGGWFAGLVALFILGVALAVVSVTDKHNKSVGERIFARLAFRSARRKKANIYRSGPLGLTPWGEFQLPGISAGSKLYEFTDSYGRPFALIHLPSTAHYTVVFGTQPDGASLVDPEQIDAWVANWGGWLASLSNEPAVVAASVTVETAPDSGARLRREVESNIHDDAPAIAKAMLREALNTYPQGSATIRAWVALTFSAAARAGGKRRTAEEIARDLASRLPSLTERLESTGAGACAPLNAQELCEVVRVAYDPAAARLIDEAHYQGTPVDLDWGDVGPSAHQSNWDGYRHDSGHSVSWTMTGAPTRTHPGISAGPPRRTARGDRPQARHLAVPADRSRPRGRHRRVRPDQRPDPGLLDQPAHSPRPGRCPCGAGHRSGGSQGGRAGQLRHGGHGHGAVLPGP